MMVIAKMMIGMKRKPARSRRITRWVGLVTGILLWQSAVAGEPIDFDTQIVPLLTRQGCNAGACHGAAIGRGGFKLSLFGSDPGADHAAMARELEGRRVHPSDPERSLILQKATETVEHGGGVRLLEGTEAHRLLTNWIAQGARRIQSRQLVGLKVEPMQVLVESPGSAVPVTVRASFDDGRSEDVTAWTLMTSDDPASVEIDEKSQTLIVKRRGEHVVVVRFLDQVRAIRLAVPLSDQVPSVEVSPADGLVDRHVNAQLHRLRIPASPAADDHEFVRRIWLDLAGQLPSVTETHRFVRDDREDKRAALIDRLLDSDALADYWALKWANILGIDSGQLQPEGAQAYHRWLTEQVRQDLPWDQAAVELLTATGDSYLEGAANFSRIGGGPRGLAEYAAGTLMGVRLRCANCHNHPLDHWEQDDYHGLAAIFAKLNRGRNVTVSSRGEVTHPVTGRPAIPRIPGSDYLAKDVDGRAAFARWIADPENPYLARATVNRIWRQLMGRGLIEPVDDLRDTNPASHPELLGALADRFVADGYRFKPLIREICNSDAYQRSSRTTPDNAADMTYFSHFIARPLEAEVIADAIAAVTTVPLRLIDGDERPAKLGETDSVAAHRAVRLTDNEIPSTALDVLGRCDRSSPCETSPAGVDGLARVLHFLNGPLLNEPIASENCVLTELLDTHEDNLDVMNELYLRAFARPLSAAEREYWAEQFPNRLASRDRPQRRAVFEDVLWSLLTSEAFLTNR